MVVPWAKNSISPGATPRAMKRASPSSTPSAGFFGVLDTFSTSRSPPCFVEQHQVGVGAADVDAEPVARRAVDGAFIGASPRRDAATGPRA